jgi:hypothetical protein
MDRVDNMRVSAKVVALPVPQRGSAFRRARSAPLTPRIS